MKDHITADDRLCGSYLPSDTPWTGDIDPCCFHACCYNLWFLFALLFLVLFACVGRYLLLMLLLLLLFVCVFFLFYPSRNTRDTLQYLEQNTHVAFFDMLSLEGGRVSESCGGRRRGKGECLFCSCPFSTHGEYCFEANTYLINWSFANQFEALPPL
jgi:hypothetical protein